MNWKELDGNQYELFLESIRSKFRFQPYNHEMPASFPAPNSVHSYERYMNENFREELHEDLCYKTQENFQKLDVPSMIALRWQGSGFSFLPNEHFDSDEFGDWQVAIWANSEYNFFLTPDLLNGVFADGINFRLTVFGRDLIRIFKDNPPLIFQKEL